MAFEHLRVYQAATQLRLEVDQIIAALSLNATWQVKNILTQIDRAADSILLNIAEGNESVYPGKRAYYFDIAIGSCAELRGGYRSLMARRFITMPQASKALSLTYLIPKMLTDLNPPPHPPAQP
jgi:four helix bundle protein